MTDIPKIDGQSADIVAGNLEALRGLFPEAFTEAKGSDGTIQHRIDFEVLRQLLGDRVVTEGEGKYGLSWHGKDRARQLALTPSAATLRPAPEESVDWDTTQNIMIEGDNLEVLKLLQKSYAGRVKLIYIDPPYNTGKDFVYPDDFRDTIGNYLTLTGQSGDGGGKLTSNPETSGRFHTVWLNMMYPRLKLARDLLRDDGAIFISIGEDEVENLITISKSIFGAENFVSCVTRIAKRTSDKGTHFRPTKDYVIVVAKSIEVLHEFGIRKDPDEKDYPFADTDGRKYKKSGASLYQPSLDSRPNQRYYIEAPDGSLIIPPGNVFPEQHKDGEKIRPKSNADKVWRWSVDTYLKQKHLLIFTKGTPKNPLVNENGKQSIWNIYPKVYFDNDMESSLHPEDVIYDYPNSQASKELNALGIPFSFSKPTGLIKFLVKLMNCEDQIVLDFFAGSSSAADAVLQLNAEDGAKRRFVMVQIPESIEEESEAYQAGFTTIAELTKERLRRAGAKIKAENPLFTGDTGFRVFKLDRSNIRAWDPDTKDLAASLLDSVNHLIPGRTDQDVLYEVLLKQGLDLCVPMQEQMYGSHKVWCIGGGVLFVCLSDKIDRPAAEAIADGIATWHKALSPATDTRLIFKDSGFIDDVAKTNLTAILAQHGLKDVRSI